MTHKTLTSRKRLHHQRLPVVALTGGVASGKSMVAKLFNDAGYIVIRADQLIKKIYSLPSTKKFVSKLIPESVDENGNILFKLLRQKAFENPKILRRLEKYLYTKLEKTFTQELKDQKKSKKIKNHDIPFIIYEIPLLFEKKLENKVDAIVVVSSKKDMQLNRLMKRDSINKKLAEQMLSQQFPLAQKVKKADFVINNNYTKANLWKEVKTILPILKEKLFADHN